MWQQLAYRLARGSIARSVALSFFVAVAVFAFGQTTANAQPWVCGSCFYVYCLNPPECENCGVYEVWDVFYNDGYCMMCGEGRCVYRGSSGEEPCAECDERQMQECLWCFI